MTNNVSSRHGDGGFFSIRENLGGGGATFVAANSNTGAIAAGHHRLGVGRGPLSSQSPKSGARLNSDSLAQSAVPEAHMAEHDGMMRDWVNSRLEAAEGRTAASIGELRSDMKSTLAEIRADQKIMLTTMQAMRTDIVDVRAERAEIRNEIRSNKQYIVGTGLALAALIIALFAFGFQVLDFARSLIESSSPRPITADQAPASPTAPSTGSTQVPPPPRP